MMSWTHRVMIGLAHGHQSEVEGSLSKLLRHEKSRRTCGELPCHEANCARTRIDSCYGTDKTQKARSEESL